MAGIYIHIPFCRQKCRYCDFYSVASDGWLDPVREGLHRELIVRCDEIREPVQTVYLGGGTPTLYSPEQLQELIRTVRAYYPANRLQEITVEANPDDLTEEYLIRLQDTEINRLSIGVQSFENEHLTLFRRRHTGLEALEAIERARKRGFENLSVDLIYGVPGMTEEQWKNNLNRIGELRIPHLSAYHLTVEPRTVFGKWAEKGILQAVAEQTSESHYRILEHWAERTGFDHYEVSNLALPGYRARHNSGYWNGTPYLGIGPGAHSYDGRVRRWNRADIRTYLERMDAGDYFDSELLSEKDRFNEYLMTRLRTAEGISREFIG
ncbi:MAG: radical SAM family heme chaperone HemW, partial [Rikenellaceae bacterium]|nr:radical SAM family heme chaperone HemW [Rikenellaceae bacterium]